jgi:hypothetical protein
LTSSLSNFSRRLILCSSSFLLAKIRYSSMFKTVSSIRLPIPCESRFGNCLSAACMVMYNSLQLWSKENFSSVPKM